VTQLGVKILAQAPAHAPVSLSFENRSSLEAAEAAAVRTSLEQQLRDAGLEIAESETKLHVTVSEDPARFLLVAQMGAGIDIVSWNRPPRSPTEYRISIKRAAVWEQRDPILDVRLSDAASSMLVLEPGRLVQYTKKDGVWQMDHATNTAPKTPVSRDPRGQIGTDETERWVPGRNYMDGGDRGYIYTKAETVPGTLLAGIDGRTRLFGQRPEPLLAIDNWGSDIAAIESACGSKRQVLVTAPATDESQDHLQAFEISAGSYSAVSEPLPLPGPVTALWTSESPDEVTLVVHNGQTGMYEASRISIVCTQ
jgi:hypothetical protein